MKALFAFALLLTSFSSLARQENANGIEPPSIPIRFQGWLPGNLDPELEGEYDIEFCLYRSPQGGAPVWRESHRIEVEGGRIDIRLGEKLSIPMDIHEATFKWIGASVNGSREVYPRYHVVNVVFASAEEGFKGRNARKASGKQTPSNTNTVERETGAPLTWKAAYMKARADGGSLPEFDAWYQALEVCSDEGILARTGHYEWVLPWAYDTASHGDLNRYFRGRFAGCDYMDLSPEKAYVYRVSLPLSEATPR